MGRKPTVNRHLPMRMRARRRGAKVWYYYDTGGKPRKEIPLGSDYAMAVKKWAELQITDKPRHQEIITFRYVAERYVRDVIPKKARSTQEVNLRHFHLMLIQLHMNWYTRDKPEKALLFASSDSQEPFSWLTWRL